MKTQTQWILEFEGPEKTNPQKRHQQDREVCPHNGMADDGGGGSFV